jgi:hypothetical protein
MNKMNKAKTALIVAILFVSAFAGTIIYYNGLLNDRNSKLASSNNQIENLNDEIANLTDEITNLTAMRAKIIDFNHGGPDSPVFGASSYVFRITVMNIGVVTLENMTLEVNLTLSDGESSNWSSSIDAQGIGESQEVSGSLLIPNVAVDISGFMQTWTFVITTPKGNIAEQTFMAL